MNNKNNILLITDDENLSKVLVKKLIFLRKTDSVIVSNYADAVINYKSALPEIILVHEDLDKKNTISLLSDLNKIDESISAILLVNSYDGEFILNAYDAGIVDFTSVNSADFELVIRSVNNLKTASLKHSLTRNSRLLTQNGIIDDLTGVYSYKYSKSAVMNEIDYNLINNGSFVAVEPAEESKTKFSIERFANSVKKSVRARDIVTLGKGTKFYMLLPNTYFNGALSVVSKIKENYGDDFKLKSGITEISGKSFEQMEHEVLSALAECAYSKMDYVFVEDKQETLDEWLDVDSSENKNYKLFRQIFNKKMDKIIAPVFYRLQKAYEEKLFDTEIEQYTNEEQCVFNLKNKKQKSSLRIVYPGFAKILIYITHEGLESPDNKEITMPLTKITQKELIKIAEDFIKEFKYTSID